MERWQPFRGARGPPLFGWAELALYLSGKWGDPHTPLSAPQTPGVGVPGSVEPLVWLWAGSPATPVLSLISLLASLAPPRTPPHAKPSPLRTPTPTDAPHTPLPDGMLSAAGSSAGRPLNCPTGACCRACASLRSCDLSGSCPIPLPLQSSGQLCGKGRSLSLL
ncbi:hypothetical protein COCON_G00018640 [Conger conger]|uniref:Uncharacterized protein n=1 Tax=Conger conger TaxID=82655 RepID=A0A9Q1E404_CONCO|nr:hypothetical protein COCON_G00018640 [Conger conger]